MNIIHPRTSSQSYRAGWKRTISKLLIRKKANLAGVICGLSSVTPLEEGGSEVIGGPFKAAGTKILVVVSL
jgi:hypothetical protein